MEGEDADGVAVAASSPLSCLVAVKANQRGDGTNAAVIVGLVFHAADAAACSCLVRRLLKTTTKRREAVGGGSS